MRQDVVVDQTKTEVSGVVLRAQAHTRPGLTVVELTTRIQVLASLSRLAVDATTSFSEAKRVDAEGNVQSVAAVWLDGTRRFVDVFQAWDDEIRELSDGDDAAAHLLWEGFRASLVREASQGESVILRTPAPGSVTVTRLSYSNPLEADFTGFGLTPEGAKNAADFLGRFLTLDLEREQRRQAIRSAELDLIIKDAIQDFRVDEATAKALLAEYELQDAASKVRGDILLRALDIIQKQQSMAMRNPEIPVWTLEEAMRYLMSDPIDFRTVDELIDGGVSFSAASDDDLA